VESGLSRRQTVSVIASPAVASGGRDDPIGRNLSENVIVQFREIEVAQAVQRERIREIQHGIQRTAPVPHVPRFPVVGERSRSGDGADFPVPVHFANPIMNRVGDKYVSL
jgi:hypothetical protein